MRGPIREPGWGTTRDATPIRRSAVPSWDTLDFGARKRNATARFLTGPLRRHPQEFLGVNNSMNISRSLRALAGIVALAGLSLSTTGCMSTAGSAPGVGISGLTLETLQRNEYVIMKTVETTGETYSVLGINLGCFGVGDNQFGHVNAWGQGQGSMIGELAAPLAELFKPKNAVAAATFKAIKAVPEADVVLPMTVEETVTGVPFIFEIGNATVKFKAIKVKPDAVQ